jgi:hypothetical protein
LRARAPGGAQTPRCAACGHFRNDPAFLEAAIPGWASLGSAHGATRADDGLCLRHDRYLSARAGCADFIVATGALRRAE